MSNSTKVLVFPKDTEHRLVYDDLAAFLDRFSERLVALGDGATANVKAGRFRAEADTYLDLVRAIDTAREECRGREDLEVRFRGDARDAFARYIGARSVQAVFQAYVHPTHVVDGHEACWVLTLQGVPKERGLGERFVNEGRRLSGTTFLETLEGTARTALEEWHG